MHESLMLSANSVAELLARIFGPSFYDGPHFGGPGPGYVRARSGMSFEQVMLNPQPLPPREHYAMALADATIGDVAEVARLSILFGGEVGQRMQEVALRQLADFEEICPRWPRWPPHWPPPPPPLWTQEEMTATELFVVGARITAAATIVQDERLQGALTDAGGRLMNMGVGKLG